MRKILDGTLDGNSGRQVYAAGFGRQAWAAVSGGDAVATVLQRTRPAYPADANR